MKIDHLLYWTLTLAITCGALACGPDPDSPPSSDGPSSVPKLTVEGVEFLKSEEQKVYLPTEEDLIRGDREFGGGPLMKVGIWFTIAEDRRSLKQHVWFRAEETKDDSTTVEKYFPPEKDSTIQLKLEEGMCIWGFAGPNYSFFKARGQDAGFEILGPLEDAAEIISLVLSLGLKLPEKEIVKLLSGLGEGEQKIDSPEPQFEGPVTGVEIIGDTGGDDISDDDNEKDDTHIRSIKYGKIWLILVPCEYVLEKED